VTSEQPLAVSLLSKSGTLELSLRAGREFKGRFSVRFLEEGKPLLYSQVSVTPNDLSEIASGLISVTDGQNGLAYKTSFDCDLVVAFEGPAECVGAGDIGIGFWTGEPYQLMKGYRFVATKEAVRQFAEDLKALLAFFPADRSVQ
jgi:hypothetical protein